MKRVLALAAVLTILAAAHADDARSAGTLAFYSARTVPGGLYARSAAGGPLRLLRTNTDSSGSAVWAPNGRHYLFEKTGDPAWTSDLWIVDTDGRNARLLERDARSPAWSRDGRRIAFDREGTIRTIRSAGGGEHRIAGPDAYDPRWSPDGRYLTIRQTSPSGGGNGSSLMLVRSTGGTPRLLARCVSWPGSWEPSGARIAFESCGPTGRSTAASGIYVQTVRTGERRRVAQKVVGPVAWSPDGKWIAFVLEGYPQRIAIIRPNGRDLRKLVTASGGLDLPWSRDSRQLAFSREGFPSDVWVTDLAGHTRRVSDGWRYGYYNINASWVPPTVSLARIGGPIVDPAIPTDSVVAGGTLQSVRTIASLAADGRRVAVQYTGGLYAGHVETWDAPAGPIVVSRVYGWQRPALAGGRFAVPLFSHAMGVNFYAIALGTVDRPNAVPIRGLCTVGSGPVNGPCIRDPIGDAVGHENLLVFDGWQGPAPYCNEPCPPPKRNGILFRVDNGAAVQLATSMNELTPLAVDAGRILVNESGGSLGVLDASGRTLATVPAPAFTEAKLQGSDVVVHEGMTLDDYDAASAALLHEWPLPPDATLEDVQDGVAAYVTSTAVHLLRLADGHEDVVAPSGHGPLHAQLEARALFYSYAVDGAKRPGRVAFVPIRP